MDRESQIIGGGLTWIFQNVFVSKPPTRNWCLLTRQRIPDPSRWFTTENETHLLKDVFFRFLGKNYIEFMFPEFSFSYFGRKIALQGAFGSMYWKFVGDDAVTSVWNGTAKEAIEMLQKIFWKLWNFEKRSKTKYVTQSGRSRIPQILENVRVVWFWNRHPAGDKDTPLKQTCAVDFFWLI